MICPKVMGDFSSSLIGDGGVKRRIFGGNWKKNKLESFFWHERTVILVSLL